MAGAHLHYLQPEYSKEYDLMKPIKPEEVRDVLEANPHIEVVYLTNPTYDGFCFNVKKMREAIGNDKIFIIDEAHGAHFYFNTEFPNSAMLGGADVAITSVHKTLGGYSATALLNVSPSSRLDPHKIKTAY